ncbi:MAG: hypothetical protein HW390_3162 [Candidatus Brocadiaceae bacterium]|nr:hypothetical protein [Candidatus Brocadiaceae bacterium]
MLVGHVPHLTIKKTQVAPMELNSLICMKYYKQAAPLGLKEMQNNLADARQSPPEGR